MLHPSPYLCQMNHDHTSRGVPPDCFAQEELEAFLALEHLLLENVFYYVVPAPTMSYLHAIEMVFAGYGPVVLAADAEEPAIRVLAQEALLEAAYGVQAQGLTMERHTAKASALWASALGTPLMGVLLSKNEDGLSLNDALVLQFKDERLLVSLHETAGLSVQLY